MGGQRRAQRKPNQCVAWLWLLRTLDAMVRPEGQPTGSVAFTSTSSSQILRVQSRNGTKRIDSAPSDTLQRFLEKVHVCVAIVYYNVMSRCNYRSRAQLQVISEFGLSASDTFSLYCSPGFRDELTRHHLSLQLRQIPLR